MTKIKNSFPNYRVTDYVPQKNELIYLDNAATTQIRPEVLGEMMPYLRNQYGNPSSLYSLGYIAKEAIDKARHRIAQSINADDNEIYFTSCGTESNNIALSSVDSIVTTPIEHHSVLNNPNIVGYTYVDTNGIVDYDGLEALIKLKNPKMVSVMCVNNEIGTIQNIHHITKIAHKYGCLMHTDAVQAFGHLPIDVKDLDVDYLSVSGHKFGAPKGVGFLYVKNGCPINNLFYGGQQEQGFRPGTENVASIVGLGVACELATKELTTNMLVENTLSKEFRNYLSDLDNIHFNGADVKVGCNTSVTIDGIDASQLVEYLNQHNIFVSSGSACNSESNEPSHVLLAIGLTEEQAESTIRVVVNSRTKKVEIQKCADVIKEFVKMMRG